MKKIFLVLSLITFLFACSDDDNTPQNPIQNLKLPDKETTFTTGQSVTIEGNGFTAESQIWLRAAGTKATGEVRAKVTAVNESSITFEVPEGVEGQQTVILKQNGQEYDLGKLTFKKSTEELCAFIWSDNEMGLCQLDLSAKTYKMVYNAEHPLSALTASEEGKIYFFTEIKGDDDAPTLGFYDFNSNTSKTVAINWLKYSNETAEGLAIGMINNKLHGVKYNEDKGFYLVKIDNSGNEILVATFGKVSGFDNNDFSSSYAKFEYNAKDNIIVISGDYNKTNYVCIAFNLTTKEISAREIENEFAIQCIYINDDCYLFGHIQGEKTTYRKINPSTLENLSSVQTLQAYICDLYYWKSKNTVLGFNSKKDSNIALKTLDLSTKEIKPMWENVEFTELVATTL